VTEEAQTNALPDGITKQIIPHFKYTQTLLTFYRYDVTPSYRLAVPKPESPFGCSGITSITGIRANRRGEVDHFLSPHGRAYTSRASC